MLRGARLLLAASLLGSWLIAADITPYATLKAAGTAKDMVYSSGQLLVATDEGEVDIFALPDTKIAQRIELPKIKDFMGDSVKPRILSVDKMGQSVLILSDSGKGGYSDLYLFSNNRLQKLFGASSKRALIKARFLDEQTILLGYMSNELARFDIKSKKESVHMQISQSKFSDFVLSEDRKRVAASSESGEIALVETKGLKIVKWLKGANVDNVYRVDMKQGYLSAAGQDRRCAIYDIAKAKGSYIMGKFLIYSTALSADASRVAYAVDEKNTIAVYKRATMSEIARLKGQKSTLNVMLFTDNNHLISASDDDEIKLWKF